MKNAKNRYITGLVLIAVILVALFAVAVHQNSELKKQDTQIKELIALYQGTKEYQAFQKACIDQFTLVMEEEVIADHRRSTSIPIKMFFSGTAFPFAEEDIRNRCEFIANQYGMTSHGRIYADGKYLSINIYPITD